MSELNRQQICAASRIRVLLTQQEETHTLLRQALEALKLALPHINPKAVDGKRLHAEPIADCYVNTICSNAITATEKGGET